MLDSKLTSLGLSAFEELLTRLGSDIDIATVEEYEDSIKQIILNEYRKGLDGERARTIATFQKELGFLIKYKTYTIKCATSLGYSIFFHNPNEGFSFQQHRTHKTELFHILKVKKNGFVFICTIDEWNEYYHESNFNAWLQGTPNSTYEKFAFRPQPGDIFVINKVGVVHTVIGCDLEEFANDSTDMVDRLHDQNANKSMPPMFNRDYVLNQIDQVAFPKNNRLISWGKDGYTVSDLHVQQITNGTKTTYAQIDFSAARYSIEPHSGTDIYCDRENATNIFFATGTGKICILDDAELESGLRPTINIASKNLILIPPKISWQVINEGASILEFSEHKLPIEMAFHKFS